MTRIRSFTTACCNRSLLWMLLCASVMGTQSIEMRAQNVETPPRITAAVDNAALTTLKGNTPFQARAAYDHGALPDSTPAGNMLIVLKRSNMQETQLRQTMSDLHNPASASYHKWLKPSEFAQQFGPADQDVQAVSNWLASQGFTVNKTSKGKTAIQFSGTAGQVRNAFHTELHTYVRNGVTFHSNNQDPQIPSALAPVVSGIAALNDIKPQSFASVLGTASFNPKTHAAVPQWTYPNAGGSVSVVLAPGDFAVQYDVNPVYQAGNTGSGETIGILESDADIDNAVVSNYRKLFGFSTANLPTTIVDGNDPASDFSGEAYLDVEVSGSVAPDAKILMYTGGSTLVTTGLYSAAIRAVDDDAADVISVSYGTCELGLGLSGNLFWNNVWSQAAAQGQSVFVSSGDSGPAGCGGGTDGLAVSGIASTPYNVAVGGTDFYYSDYNQGQATWQPQLEQYWSLTASTTPVISILKPVPEQPWNDAFGLNVGGDDPTSIGGGGGGASNCTVGTADSSTGEYISCSAGYPKPAWQTGVGVPKDGVRDIPDVSLFAANGFNFSYWPICAAETDCTAANLDSTGAVNITGVGGTSASAPAMAGIMALIDQAQKGRQGNPNYVLYALAAQAPTAFHDVTVGSNNQPCDEGTTNCSLDTNGDGHYSLQEYPAGVGYDRATGLGSVDANVLLTNWNKVTFKPTATDLTLSSTSFAHGTPVTATATVASSGGTPTGSVSLVNATAAASAGVGTIALTSGTGQASLTSLPAGTYDMVAQYGGDGTFAGSTSAPVSVTVTPENSAVAVTGQYASPLKGVNTLLPVTNGITLQYGNGFVFDVKVYGASSSAAAPDGVVTGVVTVTDNGSPITTLNLNSYGVAEITTGALAVGTHSLVFSYGGDGSFNASKSTALTFTLTKGVPDLQFSGSVPPSIPVNGTLLVPIWVYPLFGTLPVGGTVTVNFGSQSQTVPMTQINIVGNASGYGTATFNVGATPGTYALTATYSGDANLQPVSDTNSLSSIIVGTGLLATTTTTETPSATTANPDNTLTITVKVTTTGTHIPTGSVSLYSNVYPISLLKPLDATGTVVVSEPSPANGPVQWIAIYYGDQYNAASESAPVTVNDTTADFTLTSGSPEVSIPSGSTTGSTTVSVNSPGPLGLTGSVALQCATSSPNLTCALSNSSLTLPTSLTQLATTTITFTAVPPASAKLDSRGRWLGGGATLALLAFLMPVRRRARRLVRLLALLLLANVGLLGMSACGGGHSTPPTTPPTSPTSPAPTAAGSYTATITATSASNGIIHNLQVRVTVLP